MTNVVKGIVKCARCGRESIQLFVFSVNYRLGRVEDNDKLARYKQKCPYCGYEATTLDYDYLLYEITESNQSRRTNSDWSSKNWKIYSDLTITYTVKLSDDNKKSKKYFISSSDTETLDNILEEFTSYEDETNVVDDESHWNIVKYDRNTVKWTKNIETMHEPLKKLTKFLSKLTDDFEESLPKSNLMDHVKSNIRFTVCKKDSYRKYSLDITSLKNDRCSFIYYKGPVPLSNKPLSIVEFEDFKNRLNEITKNWDYTYKGDRDFNWSIVIDEETRYEGIGGCPDNWNDLIDLIIKYEKMYKSRQ